MAPALRLFALLPLLALAARTDAAHAQAARPGTHVLMVYGHDPNTPGARGFTRELHAALRNEWPEHVEVYDELLDYDRLGNREDWPRIAANIADKYKGFRIDAILAEGSIAVQFAVEQLGGTFPGVPVVYGLAFEPMVDFAALPPNVTGRRIPLPFAETFRLARRLQPDAKRVVIVAGAAMMDTVVLTAGLRDVTPLLDGMQLEVLRDWTYPSLLKRLRELPKESFVILSSFRKDWGGETFNSGDLIPSITHASAVPVYGIARNWVGDGVVGGTTMDFAYEGTRTAHLLVRVLQQPPGAKLPAREVAVNSTVVDWRQLQRWGLSEKLVPAGTTMLFKAPSLWERYEAEILLIIGVTAAQFALIGLLALERRKRIRAQHELEEQAAYEQMLAALRTDAVRYAPDDAPRALEHAVARIGRYSGARSAELVVHSDLSDQPSEVIHWSPEERSAPRGNISATGTAAVMEIPLVSDAMLVGALKLRGLPVEHGENVASRERIESAAALVAAALARAGAARALTESRGHVAHLARVATMSQLGAAVTHELRQPLTAMRTNAEAGVTLLAQNPPDVREAREAFRDIVNDNTRAMEVIEHVRSLLRSETGARESVSINDICLEGAKLVQRYAQTKNVAIDLALAEKLPEIRGDAVQLQQVVLNLVLNAIEAAAASTDERRVVIATAIRNGRIDLEIRDSGAGLAAQVQQNLFKSFFSTKKSGLGMGLAIVHQIVERHRGQVAAHNGADGGAIFRVTIPTELSA